MHIKANDSQLFVSGGGIQIKPSQAQDSAKNIMHECDTKVQYQM